MRFAFNLLLLSLFLLPVKGHTCNDELALFLRADTKELQHFSLDTLEDKLPFFQPGQSAYGLPKIAYVHHYFAHKSLKKINSLFEEKEILAVIGPNKRLWIVDGHHHFYAVTSGFDILKKRFPKKMDNLELNVKILDSFVGKTSKEFETYLRENNYVYLKSGEKITDLPGSIS